jgi:hypothetical protein
MWPMYVVEHDWMGSAADVDPRTVVIVTFPGVLSAKL